MQKQTTLKPGDTVRFKLKNVSPAEFGITGDECPADGPLVDNAEAAQLQELNGQIAHIECFVTGEPGTRDFEYYDIRFLNGIVLYAVSGYHLDNLV